MLLTFLPTEMAVPEMGSSTRRNGRSKDEIDRTKLPLPESKFKGVIGETYQSSKEDWPAVPKPPEGAPNVVVILLDDVGFGQVSTFGGPVPTPELDKLAAQGLRYNRFHTTAICGPSRACLSPVAIITIAALAFSPSGRRVSPATTT
jgi:arylsulfatase